MKLWLQLTLLLVSFSVQGQDYYRFKMMDTEETICSFDNALHISSILDWEVYQTDNDQWDGNMIEECHTITHDDNSNIYHRKFFLDLKNIDRSKSIFFKNSPSESVEQLIFPNAIYHINSFGKCDKTTYHLENQCEEDICTGIIIETESFDSLNQTTLNTVAKLSFTDEFILESCWATEKFKNQKIKNLVIKITIDSISSNQNSIEIPIKEVTLFNGIEPTTFSELFIPESTKKDTSYNGNLEEFITSSNPWNINYIGIHDNPSTPGPDNIFLIEANLEVNTTTPQVINMSIEEGESFHLQSHTEIVGGLIKGSDNIRHQLNIIQNGTNICTILVELIMGHGTNYRYQSGDINISGDKGCLLFNDGSKLIIDNADLQYGIAYKTGMLGLKSGAEVEMIGNSNLSIYNRVVLIAKEDDKENTEEFVDIKLNYGQSLTFERTSHITQFGNIKLRIYMNGGTLNTDNLSLKEKQMIVKVFPKSSKKMEDNITIAPNPVSQNLYLTTITDTPEVLQWTIYNINGKKQQNGRLILPKGTHQNLLPTNQLSSGIYILQTTNNDTSVSKKFIKI